MLNTRIQSRLRPLKLLDLPDELLMRIFGYVRVGNSRTTQFLFDAPLPPGVRQDIENLRLVCRRFCSTSSHLLIQRVRVDMTEPSTLEKLDRVSRHPTISKGVRAVQVVLRYYSSTQADDIRTFALCKAEKLDSRIETWRWSLENLSDGPNETITSAIAETTQIRDDWFRVAEDGIQGELAQGSPNELLQKAHVEYRQRYQRCAVPGDGGFVNTIQAALARMPMVTVLDLRDGTKTYNFFDEAFTPKDALDLDKIYNKLLLPPVRSWKEGLTGEEGPPPVHEFLDLLLMADQAGLRLTDLTIWTPPPVMSSIGDHQSTQLRSIAKSLTSLSFHPWQIDDTYYWAEMEPEQWQPFMRFLSTLLGSSSLNYISLDMDFMWNEDVAPCASMGPVLASCVWPALKNLYLRIPFHVHDINNIINQAPKGLEIELCGHLMSGSWSEVLDILKARKDDILATVGSCNGAAEGAECETMLPQERLFIFGRDYKRSSCNHATAYLRGYLGSECTNPVRDWENGDLVVPEDFIADDYSLY